ncbi:GNAT family N-acetyltransferase [Iamia sp.]|uniref:GNAT family N-acetyltransferase n=1 Tax=Iamia sp. TaxID=2722710 RepID=UPI002CF04AA0|nr:GNAT family N-acetyltransferase [Iamia sp.]HXH57389.1 GNAT family N-acetyltransferase [Iamia sp.]
MEPRPPERIDLGDVVLRRYTPHDTTALSAVATAERDHLSPWMAWATPSGVTVAAMTTFIAETNGRADEGTEAVYGIFTASQGLPVGACGLHDRIGPGGVEFGYWLARDATGHGLMTRVVGTLTDLVLTLDDITFVEIHCDEANVRSASVARRLGYALVRTEDCEVAAPAEIGRQQIWVRTEPTGVT